MAAPVYATPEEYEASPYGAASGSEEVITARLAIASRHVDHLIRAAVYDVDEDQEPTDTEVIEALRDATIAQASYLIDPSAGLAEGQLPAGVSSASIGSASITRSKAAPEVRSGAIAYSPEVLILLANLMYQEPYVR
jgi:hypothetical protein